MVDIALSLCYYIHNGSIDKYEINMRLIGFGDSIPAGLNKIGNDRITVDSFVKIIATVSNILMQVIMGVVI